MSTVTAFLLSCQASYILTGHASDPFPRVLKAMIQVESGGDPYAVGDGGRAIGVLQIHRAYWSDATRFLGVDWPYDDARDPLKAAAAVRAYCEHYAAHYGRPWTAETIARIHNGGPTGWRRRSTLVYWGRVRTILAESTQKK